MQNPFREVDGTYGVQRMAEYRGRPIGRSDAGEPHVYAIAEAAFGELVRTGHSQSLVVSGESGAGKTETNKHLLSYLAWRAPRAGGASDEGREGLATAVLRANPVLEAFGNAKTARNNNSSRFGKFVKIATDEAGRVLGATTRQYLLERSRVVSAGEGERSYHVFYQLCSTVLAAGPPQTAAEGVAEGRAADADLGAELANLGAELGLAGGPMAFAYLSRTGTATIDGVDDGAGYKALRVALDAIGLSAAEVRRMLGALAALLHLGNVEFDGGAGVPASEASRSQPSLSRASGLLGVEVGDLSRRLRSRTIATPGERTTVELTAAEARLARDALAKAVYAAIPLTSKILYTRSGS